MGVLGVKTLTSMQFSAYIYAKRERRRERLYKLNMAKR